jgi:putative polyhydroxyalkanoate system protein
MPQISIQRRHNLSHDEARAAAEKVAAHLKERFDLDYHWQGDVLQFNRTGVNGKMVVNPSDLRLDVQLGFMLGMFATSIEREIHKNLDEVLGA